MHSVNHEYAREGIPFLKRTLSGICGKCMTTGTSNVWLAGSFAGVSSWNNAMPDGGCPGWSMPTPTQVNFVYNNRAAFGGGYMPPYGPVYMSSQQGWFRNFDTGAYVSLGPDDLAWRFCVRQVP